MNDLLQKTIDDFLQKRRPPEKIRNKLDCECTYEDRALIVCEVRPVWNDPSRINRMEIAKAKYILSTKIWKVYWMRANGKWYPYDPVPKVNSAREFLDLVDRDPLGCFWG